MLCKICFIDCNGAVYKIMTWQQTVFETLYEDDKTQKDISKQAGCLQSAVYYSNVEWKDQVC